MTNNSGKNQENDLNKMSQVKKSDKDKFRSGKDKTLPEQSPSDINEPPPYANKASRDKTVDDERHAEEQSSAI